MASPESIFFMFVISLIVIGVVFFRLGRNAEKNELQPQLFDKEKKLKVNQVEIEVLKQQLRTRHKELTVKQGEIENLTQQLYAQDKDKVEELKNKQSEITNLKKRLEDAKKCFRDQKNELQQLQFESAKKESEIAGLKSEIDNFKWRLNRERERSTHLATMRITPEFQAAREAVYDDKIPFLFISGGAGTGKTQFLKYVLDRDAADILFVAPTGIAALNVGGRTIHSCFQFPPVENSPAKKGCLPKHQYQKEEFDFLKRIKILVIDEISMVRADMLDLISHALQTARGDYNRPFGGVKIVAVGDLYQLPPVVEGNKYPELEKAFSGKENLKEFESWESPWFFSAHCLKSMPIRYVEFTEQFRQGESEREYAAKLNQLRNDCDSSILEYFNRREMPAPDDIPRVFPHKDTVKSRNELMLKQLKSPAKIFYGEGNGTYTTQCSNKDEKDFPAPPTLELKVGARVMFVKNNGDNWKNGTMGVVESLQEMPPEVHVRIDDTGIVHSVSPDTWEDIQLNKKTGELSVVGSYTQIPLMLAWAFTAHKMQGLTLKELSFNPAGSFCSGLAYVALSRTSTINGLYLESPLKTSHVRHNGMVKKFYARLSRGMTNNDFFSDGNEQRNS